LWAFGFDRHHLILSPPFRIIHDHLIGHLQKKGHGKVSNDIIKVAIVDVGCEDVKWTVLPSIRAVRHSVHVTRYSVVKQERRERPNLSAVLKIRKRKQTMEILIGMPAAQKPLYSPYAVAMVHILFEHTKCKL
jgi:hypothetical protein